MPTLDDLLTLVINLDGSDERLAAISGDLERAGVKWERLPAVDFRGKSPDSLPDYNLKRCKIRHDGPMTGGETGCFLSHRKALQRFLEGDAKFLLVLEDDVEVPENANDFLQTLLNILEREYANNWDSVYLALTSRGYEAPAFEIDSHRALRSSFVPCGTPAILWSREGADAFLNSIYGHEIAGPVDREMRSFCARRGRSFKFANPPFDRRDFASDIESGGTRFGEGGRPTGATLRCKILRHFPDYLNAWLQTLRWKISG